MNYVDRPTSAEAAARPRRHITRADARIGFALELLPLPLFGAFYGAALAIGGGAMAGFFAAIGLVGLVASGLGWMYLDEPGAAVKVFAARLLFMALAALAVIDTSLTPLGGLIAAVGFFVALGTPALSAAVLAVKWWPRTSGYV